MASIIIFSFNMKTLTVFAISILAGYLVVSGALLFAAYSSYETCRIETERRVLQKLNHPGQMAKAVDTCNQVNKTVQGIISEIR